MEEKKSLKINLSTFFLILAIIIIIIMAYFLYKLNNDIIAETKKSSELQSQVNSLNDSENTTTVNDNNVSFSEVQVKSALSNYLELATHAGCDMLLENLEEKGKINYDSSKDTILSDGTVITSIKFSDYKNAMLNYVSESEFEKNWTSAKSFDENSNGYLTKVQGGGGLVVYTVNSIIKNNDSTYSAKTTATNVDLDNSKEDEFFTFTVTSYNKNCVIDSIK